LVESQFVLDPPFIRGSDRLFSATSDSIEGHLRKVRHLVEEGIADLQGLLNEHSATAKAELQRRLKAIRMFLPGMARSGTTRRTALGIYWDLIQDWTKDAGWMTNDFGWLGGLQCTEPAILVLPFRYSLGQVEAA
jgi:hypothetical protein